ncbi:DEAD/DEAH box helicase [Nanoarchaeota archaeon]
MIKNFQPRLYQETILATTVKKNTLVVLPTGLGKTNIFLMLAAQRLKQYPNSQIVFLAPTKPLVEQHLETFKKYFDIDPEKLTIFTGQTSPEKRVELYKKTQIIFSTPQVIENDIISSRLKLKNISLLGVDEAHRAVGDYAYVFVAQQYQKKADFPKIIALTASPGSDLEKIKEVCKNLHIEAVEARTPADPDVKDYVKPIKTEWIKVELPPQFKAIQKFIKDCYQSKINEVKKYGYLNSLYVNKMDLIKLQSQLHGQLSRGQKDFELLKSISLLAEAMKIQHALVLLETQGIAALKKYLEKLQQESLTAKTRAVKNLVQDINFKSAYIKTINLFEMNVKHPKLTKLKELVKIETEKNHKVKIIIFTQYRDSASEITQELEQLRQKAKTFVGQTKKGETGLSQKEQKEILDQFRNEEFNILVATSVGEEGLDIPAVDLVIFYEPIPSAIRHIQRRGRTGRQEQGRVLILQTNETRDSGYRWSAFHKEKRMFRTLDQIKKEFTLKSVPTLTQFIPSEQKIQILADHREKGSGVIKEIINLGFDLKLEQLDSADYLCSPECAVEFKTVPDFVHSIIDGRLLDQLRQLKKNYARPLVIIEGEEDIYSVRKVHPNAIRGMLAAITVSYGVPIIQTKNFKETAALLATIAKREQSKDRDFSLHTRKPLSLKEQQEYLVSSMPSVGPNIAQDLLKHFKTIKNLVNSSEEELKKVPKVGPTITKKLKELFEKEYEK